MATYVAHSGKTKTPITSALLASLAILLNINSINVPAQENKTERIVTLGGAITETVFALGAGNNLVAVDASSTFPAEAHDLTDVGYYRQISAEGVLSLAPSLIIASSDAGPANAIAQLRESAVEYVTIEQEKTAEGVQQLIAEVGEALGRTEAAAELQKKVSAQFDAVAELLAETDEQPATMIIHARGPGALHVAGRGTSGDTVINLAGGTNCADFGGFRPLTEEGLLILQPEVVILMAPGFSEEEALRSLDGHKGLGLTPAGKSGRIHAMDGLYLLGFGPRQGRAVKDLALLIHPALVDKVAIAPADSADAAAHSDKYVKAEAVAGE